MESVAIRGKGIFVTGTDTDVGKTQVTAGLAAALQRRWNGAGGSAPQAASSRADAGAVFAGTPVRLWKPVQSGAAAGSPQTDSHRLLMGSGLPLAEADIASRTYPAPLAPWLAAREAGEEGDFVGLLSEGRSRLNQPGFWLVEGAGGLLVPLTADRLVADLAHALGLPLVVVARPELGTVNHTLLTVASARQAGLRVLGVILNGCRDMDARHVLDNAMMIERFGRVPVLGRLPWLPLEQADEAGWADWRARWTEEIERHVKLDVLEHSIG